MPTSRLISFKLCPFVQRSVITLLEKNVDFDIEYIDLANKPQWFLDISPAGKVPVLQVGDEVLFESAVINEYLDEVHPPSLHPGDPLQKAKNRAWIEFGSSLLTTLFQLTSAKEQEALQEKIAALRKQFGRLENVLGDGDFFNGEAFSLIDTSYAPLAMRLQIVEDNHPLGILENLPRTAAWFAALNARDSVQKSVVPELPELYWNFIKARGGLVAA